MASSTSSSRCTGGSAPQMPSGAAGVRSIVACAAPGGAHRRGADPGHDPNFGSGTVKVGFHGPMARAASLRSAVALLGQFPVLAGVDLDIDEGTVVSILGPNGAGKTSLLQLLAGLLALRSGSGAVLGCDLGGDRRDLRDQVGLLGHAPTFYAELSATENLTFGLRAMRRPVA